MKYFISILFAIVSLSAAGQENSRIFLQAQAAYDEGRPAEAIKLYKELLTQGVANTEVYYNLANACFKNGNLPHAVLHYRTAWHAAPRDPDILANLHFALNAAGAVEPTPSIMDRLLFTLSANEWIMVAIGGYVLFCLLLILALLIRPAKRLLVKWSLLPLITILLAAGGWWQWQTLTINPEWVVIKSGATALYGPFEGSTAHYKLPLAALVRQRKTDPKGWVEVVYDGKAGWIKTDYIQRVSP